WSNGATTAQVDNLSGTSYEVTISDNVGDCSTTVTVILTDDVAGATVTITAGTTVSCAGESDGLVDYTVSYDAGFVVDATIAIISQADGLAKENGSLAPGSYCIEVRDGNGCLAGQSCFEVLDVAPLSASLAVTDVDCDANGSIAVSVTGGTGAYEYLWSTGETNASITNLLAASYSVTITDAAGCTMSIEDIEVANIGVGCSTNCEEPVLANAAIINSSCGNTAGEIWLEMENATIDYKYDWSIGTSTTAANVTSLVADSYQVTITSLLPGCNLSIVENFVITNVDGPQVTLTNINNTVCGQSTGTAEANVVSGSAPYTYLWSNGQNTAQATNLSAGAHQVSVTDAAGCTSITEVEIEEDNLLMATVTMISLPNCQMANGVVEVQVTGGSNDYSYLWSNGATTTQVDTLIAGTYTVTATDNIGGCTTTTNFTVVNQVDGQATVFISNPDSLITLSCPEDTNGEVLYEVNFDPNFVYPVIVEIRDAEGNIYENGSLAPGSYCVVVTNGDSCIAGQACFEVIAPNPFEVALTIVNEDCEDTGSIQVNVSGGNGGYNFVWSDDGGMLNTDFRSNLTAGTYDVTITDVQGCTTVTTGIVVGQDCPGPCIDPVIETITLVNPTCGAQNGTIDIDLPGNDADYIFEWNPAVTTTDAVTNLAAGVYNVSIRSNVDSCSQFILDTMIVLTNTDGPMVSIETTIESCDTNDGTATIVDLASGYNVIWSTGDTTAQVTNLVAGTYFVTVTEGVCSNVFMATIDYDCVPPCEELFSVDEEILTINNCNGNGSYCLDIALNEFYLYSVVEDGTTFTGEIEGCSFDSLVNYAYLNLPGLGEVGPYNLEYWSVNGTIFSGEFATISDLVDSMNIWDTTTDWILDPASLLIYGGLPSNTYGQLKIAQTLTGSSSILQLNVNLIPNGTAILLEVGAHNLIVTNNVTGCADTVNVIVNCIQPEIIVDTIYVGDIDTLCISTDELLGEVVSIENVCGDFSGEFVEFDVDSDTYCLTCAGFDIGTDSACIVVCDDLGICDTTYIYITVVEFLQSLPGIKDDIDTTYQGVPIEIDILTNDSLVGELDSLIIMTLPSHGTAVLTDDNTVMYTPEDDYCNSQEPDYFNYVLCVDQVCDTATVYVYVLCEGLTIYTGFSPNGDGVNDFFFIEGIEDFPNNELSIFNRWGNEVYFKEGYLNDWDGTWEGKLLPDGTYFYVLEDGEGNAYSGYVQIHR
ncbi:MAG: gliding motility-associated C-terminal domain-containing protein, partial [Saprospiraceae bacterium]